MYDGPCVERAPDIVIELALDSGYGLSLIPTPWSEPQAGSVRTLLDDELAGGRGRGMNGTHRPAGVWIATGAAVDWLDPSSAPSLDDVAPALARALDLPGRWEDGDSDMDASPRRVYTAEEEARVAARLRALGYLE